MELDMKGTGFGSESGVQNDSSMPVDIIIRILLWLPVASLLRFKRVSRDWLSLIESSHFIYQHHHFNKINNNGKRSLILLLSGPDKYNDNEQEISVFSFEDESEIVLDFPFIDDPFKFHSVELVASCRGIICLRQYRTVCLWNPTTNQSTNLPPLPQVPFDCHIGFGFDLKTNDYKVACLSRSAKVTTSVYSFSSKYWRTEECSIVDNLCYLWSDLKTPYRDSIYCWIFQNLDNETPHMLSFDCSSEVFKRIPMPNNCINLIPWALALFILRENIASIYREGDDPDSLTDSSQRYEVWVLNDYDVDDSWTKLYVIDSFSSDFRWITWFSNNRDLLLFLEYNQLCLYDIVAQEVEQLPVQVGEGFEVVTYQESLFSVERGSAAAASCQNCEVQQALMPINQSMTGSYSCWGDANITQVVVFKILLWLPVVSLVRFKLVCKSWCSLIKSSEFVSQHLHLHQNDNEHIDFILLSEFDSFFEDSSHPSSATSYAGLLSTNEFKLLDLPCRDSWKCSLVKIISFDGIICLRVGDEIDVYLWNPATKQFRVVIAEPTGVLQREDEEMSFRVGFGFDVKTNDYKLIRFFTDEWNIISAKVYSLSTGSWRIIHDEVLSTVNHVHLMPTPYRKGINCWVANDYYGSYDVAILSFDFSSEVFGIIALPDGINRETHVVHDLAVLSNNIVCIVLDRNEGVTDWHCEIWMMNEYGVMDSWTKLYTVGPFSQDWRLAKQYYSKKDGDYILLQKGRLLYEYEVVTQETKELSVEVPENCEVTVYKESLVPIK